MEERLAQELGELLKQRQQLVTTAESCTGGLISAAITDVAGSSDWFQRGFVVYSNAAKYEVLDVPETLIEQYGAVSDEVVCAMARQARLLADADWAIAVSGIAGPGGGSDDKPVGLVWFAWAGPVCIMAEKCQFKGSRKVVRKHAVQHAIKRLIQLIKEQHV